MVINNYIFNDFINYYKNETFEIIHIVKMDGKIYETYFEMNADEVFKLFENTCYEEIKDCEDYIKIIINNTNHYIVGV